MFNFWKDEEEIEMQVMRPHRIRAKNVVSRQHHTDAAEKLFDKIPSSNDSLVFTDVFDKLITHDNSDPTELYTVFYLTEKQIEDTMNKRNAPLYKEIEELREQAKNDPDNKQKYESKILEHEENIKKNRHYATLKRHRLYEGFIEYLHDKYDGDGKKIDAVIYSLTDWHLPEHDPVHARMVTYLIPHKEALNKNEAYGNPWYMMVMGILLLVLGASLLTASLVTGFAAPYLFVFGAIGLSGLCLTLISGKQTASDLLAHRIRMNVDEELYSKETMESSKKYQKSESSMLNSVTWQTAPLYLLGVAGIVLLLVDAALGGPLSVLGSALKFDIIPYYKLAVDFSSVIPHWDMPLAEMIVNSLGAIFSSSSLNFFLLGGIVWLGAEILSFATNFSNNKTYQRVHSMIRQFADNIKWTYGICGGASMFFGYESLLSLPMLGMVGAGAAILIIGYRYFAKGETEFVMQANPGIGGYFASPEKKITYKSVLMYSAAIILVCSLSLFVFPASPITFGVLFIVASGILTIAQDQMKAIAERRNAKENYEMIKLDAHQQHQKSEIIPHKGISPKQHVSATNDPVQMSRSTPVAVAVAVKQSPSMNQK